MEYELTRSKRKTLAIHIKNGRVEVRAPLKMAQRDIDRFVTSKEKWITDRLARSREQVERREAFTLDYGDMVVYRGREYPIVAREGKYVGFDDSAVGGAAVDDKVVDDSAEGGAVFYMPPGLQPGRIKAACVVIYRMLAKRDLTIKTLDFAKRMGENPTAVKITGAKTRWGSCSSMKSINFSWRLIMADDDVIDYVVIHELAHLAEMNHSDRFWAIVEGVLPDFRKRKARLRELQKRLSAEDWE